MVIDFSSGGVMVHQIASNLIVISYSSLKTEDEALIVVGYCGLRKVNTCTMIINEMQQTIISSLMRTKQTL